MTLFENGERYRTSGGLWVLVTDIKRGKRRVDCTVHDRGKAIRAQIAVLNGGERTRKTEAISFVGADGGYYTVVAKRASEG